MAEPAASTTPSQTGPRLRPRRRSFLAWSGVAAGTTALVATTDLGMPGSGPAAAAEVEGMAEADKTVWSACTVNCGSRCPLRLQVKDGTVVRVLPDNTGDNNLGTQTVRACVRGRSIRHRIYNPDRLKKPLRRKAGTKRGAGEWEEISWEEALTEIAEKMKAIKQKHGNEAFYINYGTGTLGATMACSWPPDQTPFSRMMNCWGGYLDHYSDYSTTEITAAYPYFYGDWVSSNSLDDAKNSKLQVFFGNNPLETRMSGGGLTFVSQQTRKDSGVRTIVVDPRYSETAALLADEWVAVRPGTDAALIAGMIHVMLKENLHDQDFLDRYCLGFDEQHMPAGAPANASYRSYIEGKGPDGVEKTPQWAADICGVPADQITRLAREIAGAKPCAINQGWGPQRHANGENEARAIFLLACVTGNIGIPGGGTGGREAAPGLSIKKVFNAGTTNPQPHIISVFSWLDAIDHGEKMTTFNAGVCEKPKPGVRAAKVPIDDAGNPTDTALTTPIKMVWQYAGNSIVNQTGGNNQSVEILQDDTKCELIVVCDIQMTVSARYADYVLPGTSAAEEFDLHPGENASPMAYGIMSTQAIEPLYECRTVFDICGQLAEKLGTDVKDAYYEGKDREAWLRATVDASREKDPELPTYDEWVKMGLYRRNVGAVIPLEEFRQDPEANKLETPSGKIEIYSERLAKMAQKWTWDEFRTPLAGDQLTPLPEFTPTWEGALEARESDKYPLQIIGHHYRQRTHSTYGNVDWMQEAHHQYLAINPVDAAPRGIKNGDLVFAYNDRGTIRIEARVTERIVPGVVDLPQGAWFNPQPTSEVAPPKGANPKYPVDINGSVNTLTSLHPSPLAKGNAVHTTTVQVVKA
ncbi:Dimethyl sulfoxide reductase DmsA precursor [Actinomyces bovis]|uniref:Dimethyl sulfoxide reductase DmsA n=1 Tax=Actinomyces bovis TaxID=1658 RepID=A0ABY1VN30_9ACTO|nr:DMSO/selenate family reductase complex A subunit [Actinomyces bovis]SPT53509.1 Dimethyl sulfoxide reductase DmsA precursor [Actinomyces bovis]VEG55430.1 Dimethyl sulfoxide reductase DmsA precursor [Actinomyces israelii]